jgi:Mrp family chromosome partitioning ATPase
MGRMLDALRRPGDAPARQPADDAEPMLVETEEIPFIEVGPRKSLEASPSVLACTPPAVPSLALRADGRSHQPAAPTRESEVIAATPRSVQFRPLPSRPAARSCFAPELVAYHAPDQPAAQQYRDVLDAVLRASSTSERSSALLFTSALPRSGATTTLLNLAVTAAGQRRQRVVVVDAHFRRPAVAERLGLPAAPGLSEAMAGAVALDEVIQETEQPHLFALTAGVRDTAGVRFVAETLRSLLRQLRQRYPLVFVDGPRWDGKPDGIALAAACDAVFLVAPESEAETPQTDALLRLIAEYGARVAGCILVADQVPCQPVVPARDALAGAAGWPKK